METKNETNIFGGITRGGLAWWLLNHARPGKSLVVIPDEADVFDVVLAMDVVLRDGAPLLDPNADCPFTPIDVNCDTVTDIFDLVAIVDVAFRNGDPSVVYCNPCGL